MTRITLELTAVDDHAAVRILTTLVDSIKESHARYDHGTDVLAPGYGVSDTDGSCECKVTHENNGIERGIEVTL